MSQKSSVREQFIGGEESSRQDVFPWRQKQRLVWSAAGAGRGQVSGEVVVLAETV